MVRVLVNCQLHYSLSCGPAHSTNWFTKDAPWSLKLQRDIYAASKRQCHHEQKIQQHVHIPGCMNRHASRDSHSACMQLLGGSQHTVAITKDAHSVKQRRRWRWHQHSTRIIDRAVCISERHLWHRSASGQEASGPTACDTHNPCCRSWKMGTVEGMLHREHETDTMSAGSKKEGESEPNNGTSAPGVLLINFTESVQCTRANFFAKSDVIRAPRAYLIFRVESLNSTDLHRSRKAKPPASVNATCCFTCPLHPCKIENADGHSQAIHHIPKPEQWQSAVARY